MVPRKLDAHPVLAPDAKSSAPYARRSSNADTV
jgi:hypothetical protein